LNVHNCGFIKHGTKHDKYMNYDNGKRTMIPRHTEIDSDLCALICKQLEIPSPSEK
jgi:hypothetical protein